MGNKMPQLICNHCGKVNPTVYFKPVGNGCVCYKCADDRKWLNGDGDLRPDIKL
jgi:recombinational DNA repair protein (RecF pathway)